MTADKHIRPVKEVNEHPGSWPGCSLSTQPLGATDLTAGSLSRTVSSHLLPLRWPGQCPPPPTWGTCSAALFGEPSPAATLPSQLWSQKARLSCRGLTNTSSHSTFIRTPESSLLLPFGLSTCVPGPPRESAPRDPGRPVTQIAYGISDRRQGSCLGSGLTRGETQAGEGRPRAGSSLPGPALLSGAEHLRPGGLGSFRHSGCVPFGGTA